MQMTGVRVVNIEYRSTDRRFSIALIVLYYKAMTNERKWIMKNEDFSKVPKLLFV